MLTRIQHIAVQRCIERVQQKETCGCTVAAIAMVIGKSYDEVRSASTRDFEGKSGGVHIEDWFDYLFEHGFVAHRMWKVTHLQGVNTPRPCWPPKPFAPLHICSVRTPAGEHAVVMLGDGTVLDPFTSDRDSLSCYESVSAVYGLFYIGPISIEEWYVARRTQNVVNGWDCANRVLERRRNGKFRES